MEPYIGEIRLLPYSFAPLYWQDCDGSLLSISGNEVLYTVIGTTFGGDGVNTFAVPDLRGRLPVHRGTGLGLSTYVLGQMAGTEAVTLLTANLPQHNHVALITNALANTGTPSTTVELGAISGDAMYTGDISGLTPHPAATSMIGVAGGNQPHDNTMPTLTVRFCIALQGIFPSQQ